MEQEQNKPFSTYIGGQTGFPTPLTQDEETYHLDRFRNGLTESDRNESRRILLEHNLRLVAHIAKKYSTVGATQDELISIGTIGLIKALSSFNESKGARLGTYAVSCIQNEILMYIRANKKYNGEVSMNEPIGIDRDGNEIVLMDLLRCDDSELVEEVDRSVQKKAVRKAVQNLEEDRERLIIQLRYGLLNGAEKTQREVGRMLGISRSYVSRIEKAALEKIKEAVQGCVGDFG
ncbi:MAG: RNA polymerase sporulation sigma factor SigK [Clostridia bacterium]|nr:RNA polymerase sporulation sigma factor SigK [Clostridia bacterium]